jgi:hypothetical protein
MTVVGVSDYSVGVFEHLRKGKRTSSFYITSVVIEGAVSEKFLK